MNQPFDGNREDMFTNQSFTENKAVINRGTVVICCSISQPRFCISKHPSVRRCRIWCRLLNSFQNVENHNSRSEDWILVMLSRFARCGKNFQILIHSPLQIKSLHVLSKFHSYLFNGLGEK